MSRFHAPLKLYLINYQILLVSKISAYHFQDCTNYIARYTARNYHCILQLHTVIASILTTERQKGLNHLQTTNTQNHLANCASKPAIAATHGPHSLVRSALRSVSVRSGKFTYRVVANEKPITICFLKKTDRSWRALTKIGISANMTGIIPSFSTGLKSQYSLFTVH